MTCSHDLLALFPSTIPSKRRGKNLQTTSREPRATLRKSPQTQQSPPVVSFHQSPKMSDRRETQNKPLVILSNSADYPRWKSYAMSELRQQGCEWTVTGRERPTIESIRGKLIEKGFTNAQLKPQILINALMHDEEKYDLAMSKSAGILSKLVSDQHQPIIEGKTPEEAWNILQERFQHINPMSISRLIYEATTKKLSEFKDVHEYTSSYQAAFDKVVGLLTETSHYTRKSTEMYFQATMLMNIGSECSALVSAIQKDWKDETTNLAETVLQIIRHFEFMEGTEKDKSVLQTSTSRPTPAAPKGSCKNPECIEKGLTTHYTDRCWIKHPELRQKYALGRMRTRGSQRNLKAEESKDVKTEPTPERES